MRTFKKISALVIAIAMIMTCAFTTVSFAAEFTDVADTNMYATAIAELADKGIINGYANEDGTYSFKPEGEITRAEFAKIIAVASAPKGFTFPAAVSSFTDVEAGHWAVPYIEYAVKSGIINGMGDGLFAPSAPVTYAQAVKMVVCALNYGAVITPAPAGTPWYQPYIELANAKNITLNAFGNPDSNAVRGLVAQLTYNMTKTNPLVQTGNGSYSDSVESSPYPEEKVEGQVVAIYDRMFFGVNGNPRTDEIILKIGDDRYEYLNMGDKSAEDFDQYFGYKVDVVYVEDDSGDKVIESISKDKKNKVYEISGEDISNITESVFEYYDDSDTKDGISKLKINDEMSIVLNNGNIDSEDYMDALDIDSGDITFIDADGNGVMDVAFISCYETYFVSSVSKSSDTYTVYDKFDSSKDPLILNDKTQELTVKIVTNTAKLTECTLASITKDCVLSVAVSADDEDVMEIIISKKTASGSSSTSAVKGFKDDSIKFDSEYVPVSGYYKSISDQSSQSLNVGDVCTAYLDFNGKLVAVSKTETATNYGYITKVGTKSSSMDDDEYFVRLYSSSTYNEYPVASKGFKLNGKSSDGEALEDAIRASAEIINADKDESKIENAVKATPVKYEIVNGELKAVYVVDAVTDEDDDDYISTAIHPNYIAEGMQELKFQSSNNAFYKGSTKKFSISSATKVIVVPFDRNENKYKFTTGASYFTNGLTYYVDAFDGVGTGASKVVVVYGTSTTIKATAPSLLVKEIEHTLSDDNSTNIYRLHYHKLGTNDAVYSNYYTTDSDVFADVKMGDIIKVFATDDVVEKVQKWFSAEDLEIPEDIDDNVRYNHDVEGYTYYDIGGEYFAQFGTVMAIPKGDDPKEHIDISTTGDEKDIHTYKLKSTTPVIRYTGDEDKPFEFGKTLDEIADIDPSPSAASKVFVSHTGSNYPAAIVIYE